MKLKNVFSHIHNYSFVLKCLAALITAALLVAAIIALTHHSVITVPCLAAASMTAIAASSLVLPIGAAVFAIAAICCLPFLFKRRSTTWVSSLPSMFNNDGCTRVNVSAPPYYQPPVYNYPITSYPSTRHVHGHTNVHGRANVHGHDSRGLGHGGPRVVVT